MELLLLGATGAVGREVLDMALADPSVSRITAPTRRALLPHDKLHNPVLDFDKGLPDADWWHADALVSCLGTTIRKAGDRAAFRRVDHDLILMCAHRAKTQETPVMVLNSSVGANPRSRNFYLRTKGEIEKSLQKLAFERLVLVRPSLIDAQRDEPRLAEQVSLLASRLMRPLTPARYRPVTARHIADCLLRATRGDAGVSVIESEKIRSAGA
ncbi:Rossmann-fold NAD(P)-binding domain-containing protein [Marinobacter fonticola]|uniref:NAD-dependent dehydratase n=1 Tax=Marinobacter fonticola TaxID=2603215 RepID=UPI0011E6DAF8|nr:NAD-dependent dehydratase [Marinobacter fonticola]